MIGYIVSRREENLIQIDEEITLWKQQLSETTNPETFNQIIREIKMKVEKAEKDTIEIKKRKYLRDTNDYKTGNIRFPKRSNSYVKKQNPRKNYQHTQEESEPLHHDRNFYRDNTLELKSHREAQRRNTYTKELPHTTYRHPYNRYRNQNRSYSDVVKQGSYKHDRKRLHQDSPSKTKRMSSYRPKEGGEYEKEKKYPPKRDNSDTGNIGNHYPNPSSKSYPTKEQKRNEKDSIHYDDTTRPIRIRERISEDHQTTSAPSSSVFWRDPMHEKLKWQEKPPSWESPGKRQRPIDYDTEEEEIRNKGKRGKK
ncbi:Hypothetical predicted protein [Pelobates cultripes]|uniref:Uncharacterized protein n=1 Tax=Pelobates cultripes TaxID=61616 RepID=A0AAD1WBD6_PELCU|nr:Hypothetical predicted protein [Pelobates cultripes]